MAEHKTSITPLNDEQLDDIGGGTALGGDCGVPENEFPYMGKCCSKRTCISDVAYKEICPCCSVWSSLPDSASLKVTYILECNLYGHVKRIKE